MHPSNGIIRIYCDFDGTVITTDAGNAFFERFSGPSMWEDNTLYRNGSISAQELYRRNAAKISGLTSAKIDSFCRECIVDPSFPPFHRWLLDRGYPCLIVSDGFDVYIERILTSAQLDIPYRANTMVVREAGTCSVDFPYSFPDCTCSANCKRNHLLLNSGDADYIVYIGDGISDFCPAQYADIVFAKGALETFCQQQNITFKRYTGFDDVRRALEEMSAKRKLKQPLRARLLRNAVWMSG